MKKISTIPLFGILCCMYFVACQPTNTATDTPTPIEASTTSSDEWLLQGGDHLQAGKITPTTAEADLPKLFGAENVRATDIQIADMEAFKGTSLYENTANELQIVWTNPSHTRPEIVRATKAAGQWHSPKGIRVGMSLADLVRLNGGKAISFMGFGWDYGGGVTNWNGGDLAQEHIMVGLQVGEIGQDLASIYEQVIGENEFSSDTKDLEKLGITVGEISLSLNPPE